MKKTYRMLISLITIVLAICVIANVFTRNAEQSTIRIGWLTLSENASESWNWEEILTKRQEEDNAYLKECEKPYQLEYKSIIADESSDWREQLKNIDLVYGTNGCFFTLEDLNENFIDLSKELKEGRLRAVYDSMPETYWESLQIGSNIYNMVRFTPPAIHGLWIDQRVLDKIQLTVPEELIGQPLEKWDKFFAAIYEKNGQKPFMDVPDLTMTDASPILSANVWEAHFQMVAPHLGISYDEPELGVQCIYESQYAKKMNDVWRKYFDAGYIGARWDEAAKDTLFIRAHVSYALSPYFISESYCVYPLQECSYSTNGAEDRENPYSLMLQVTKNAADKDTVYEFLCDLAEEQEFAQTICKQEIGSKFFTPMAQMMNRLGGGNVMLNGLTEPVQENREMILTQYNKMQHCIAPGFILKPEENINTILQNIEKIIYEEKDGEILQHNVIKEIAQGSMKWADYEKALELFVQRLYEEGIEEVKEEANRQLQEYIGK